MEASDYMTARSLPTASSMPSSQSRNSQYSNISETSSAARTGNGTPSTIGSSASRRISMGTGRTIKRVTSRLARISEGTVASMPEPQREWSLFGQRMENEGQMNVPRTPRTPRPVGSRPVSYGGVSTSAPSGSRSRPHTSILIPPISSQSFLDTGSQYQSPTEDPSLLEGPVFQPAALASTNSSSSELVSPALSESPSTPPTTTWKEYFRRLLYVVNPRNFTTLQKNILKCSIAYFLGSLFTFNPYLSEMVGSISGNGPSASAHMVATVAVYFNPAKTAGGMIEADIYCIMGLVFAGFVSLVSMDSFWFFEVKPGQEWLADVTVIFWVGLAVSMIAWMKQWMAKPTFNPACSMAAIILFTVVVKEGDVNTLAQVACLVLFGTIIANVVCYGIWPHSATTNLQKSMTTTLDSFSTLLALITDTFLLEESLMQPSQTKIGRAVENHQASFVKLKKDLAEAYSEVLLGGPKRPTKNAGPRDLGKAYEDSVDSLNRLGQHLNGLRSGTRLQYELTRARLDGKVHLGRHRAERRRAKEAAGVAETKDDEEQALLQAAADMFGELVNDVGSPLKALSTACQRSLKTLSEALQNTSMNFEAFAALVEDIDHAMKAFESTSNQAMMRIYRKGVFQPETHGHGADRMSTVSCTTELEESSFLSESQNENLFLVYFFIFTLQEFARELDCLVDALGRICALEQAKKTRGGIIRRLLRKLRGGSSSETGQQHARNTGNGQAERGNRTIKRPISTYFKRHEQKRKKSWFPKVKPHAPDTLQTPGWQHLTFYGRFKQRIWTIGNRLRDSDFKYALKAGMSTALLAAPAWFEKTRPVFMEYRGEWALISFFVVISPTIGATNSLSLHRILGTIFGATTAATIFLLFSNSPVVLSIFGFLFSIPCFYYIVSFPQYATTGRFVLLTYNLTCLFSYNSRQNDASVVEVAVKRSVAVTVGVIWAFIVSRVWWPSEARRELGKALGELCLNIGWLYIRLVAHNSLSPDPVDSHGEDTPNEHSPLILPHTAKWQAGIRDFMAMELHLQIKLIELQGLLAQAQHEPRLKGPFPVKLYRGILTSLQTILDRLHSMRCVTTRDEWFTNVRQDYILPVNRQRKEVIGNIVLFLSLLSSAFQLKTPLPPYLPPVEQSRTALVDAIKELNTIKAGEVQASEQLLFFAYAMTMKGVTQELESLGKTLQDAFGVIGQNQFDALFAAPMV